MIARTDEGNQFDDGLSWRESVEESWVYPLAGRCRNLALGVYDFSCNAPEYIQAAFVVLLWSVSFFYMYDVQRENEQDMAYAIVRGTGAAIKCLLPIIFVPTLRMIHAKAYENLPLRLKTSVIGSLFHHRMSFHKYLGEGVIASALIHTAAHTYRHSVSFFSQEGMTGMGMLVSVGVPIASMYVLRASHTTISQWAHKKSYYWQFLLPHQIGWWGFMLAYGIHTKDYRLLKWSLGFSGLFSVDRVWEWIKSRNVDVKNIERVHDGMMVLELEKPEDFRFSPGQKAYLSYHPASAFVNNLHPFTIASSPEEGVIRFIISISGEWTRKLLQELKIGDKVRISPPFPSPLGVTNNASDRLLISSGSGLASTLAQLHDFEDKSPISIIHSTRHPEEFAYLNRFVNSRRYSVNSAKYFYTRKINKRSKSIAPGKTAYSKGRFVPKSSRLLNGFEGRIYYCGNEALGDAVEKAVRKHRKKVLLREHFSF